MRRFGLPFVCSALPCPVLMKRSGSLLAKQLGTHGVRNGVLAFCRRLAHTITEVRMKVPHKHVQHAKDMLRKSPQRAGTEHY